MIIRCLFISIGNGVYGVENLYVGVGQLDMAACHHATRDIEKF